MSLKNCPFCFGRASVLWISGDNPPSNGAIECVECRATAPDEEAWNTRAAPTMKPWVWVERNACHDPLGHVWHCENYNAFMVRDGANWKTRIGNEHICSLPIKEAQAACVAYVEGKLKEWLV